MLTEDFNNEMGALIRRLSQRIRNDQTLRLADEDDALAEIADAIVILCALYISLSAKQQ